MPVPPVVSGASLVRGAVVYGGRQVAMTLLGAVTSLLLTRLLVPEDFGRIAAVMVIAGVTRVLSLGGVGLYLIQQSGGATDDDLSVARTLQVVIYAALQLVTLALAGLAPYLGLDRELWLIIALSVSALAFGVLRSGSAILLERRLAFGAIARIEVTEHVTNTVVVISLAVAGAGAWSVAAAAVAAAAVAWRMSRLAAPFRYQLRWPRFTPELKRGLRFSAEMIAPNVIGAARLAALPVIMGAVAGIAAVGFAERALFIATLPFALLGGIQQRILFTVTARLQQDVAAVRRVLEETTYISAVADKLLYLPLAAFSPAIIGLLLSDAWLPIAPTVEVITWGCAAFGSFVSCASPVLTGLGRARVIAMMNVLMLVVTWFALLPLARWAGAHGYGYVQLVLWFSAPFLLLHARRALGSLKVVRITLVPFVAFTAAVLAVRHAAAWLAPEPALLPLVVFSGLGVSLYLTILFLVDGSRLMRTTRFVADSLPLVARYRAARP